MKGKMPLRLYPKIKIEYESSLKHQTASLCILELLIYQILSLINIFQVKIDRISKSKLKFIKLHSI